MKKSLSCFLLFFGFRVSSFTVFTGLVGEAFLTAEKVAKTLMFVCLAFIMINVRAGIRIG